MSSTGTYARNPDIHGWFTPWRFGLLMAMAIGAVFPQVIFGGETFFYRDFGVLAYPSVFYHRECFWRGELPLWNPLSNCGAPFLAQWGTMVLYPFSLFYLLLPLPWSLNAFCLGHLFLGGMGAYWLASSWTRNRFAGSVAGFSYVFSGAMFSCLLWPNYAVALGWMPWVVWSAERSWRDGGRWVVLAGLIAAMQLLAGVPEVVMLTWLLVGGLLLVDVFEGGFNRLVAIRRIFVVMLIVAGLTAAQILPFLELIQHSQRDRAFATAKWSMPVTGIVNFLVPMFHNFRTPQGIYFQVGQQFLSSTYLGVGTLALAACAPLIIRNRRALLLSLLVVVSVVFAIGDNGPIYRGIKSVFPLMGFARYPIKFLLLAAFTVPLLAAMAVAAISESRAGEKWGRGVSSLIAVACASLFGIGVILMFARKNPFPGDEWPVILVSGLSRALVLTLIFALVAALRTRLAHLAAGGILLLIVTDAASHTPRQNPTLPSRVLAPGLWETVHRFLPPKVGESRVMISPSAEEALLKSGVTDFESDFLGKRLAGWSHLNLIEAVPKVNGSSTLQVREQAQVQSLLYGTTNQAWPGLLDFLAVSYISSESNALVWVRRTTQSRLVSIGKRPVFTAPGLPGYLTDTAFDPRLVVCLPSAAAQVVTAGEVTGAKATLETFVANRVLCEVETPGPAILSVAQSYYPSWRATVDDQPVKLWHANHAFQAIEVPAGRHRVEFKYVDRPFQLGCGVSVVTLLFSGFIWWRSRRKLERPPENKSSPDV
ncbi:MAG: hypothetical protein EXS31_06640 [Pedosphaera sp.]|nr:hypothetical protein [Pedosphaera sp.]